jgi:tetratricopeptide (TPR) repeat protein
LERPYSPPPHLGVAQKQERFDLWDDAQQTGQRQGEANPLKATDDVQSFRKEMDAALASYDQALELYKQVGDKLGQANARLSKGELTNDSEEFEEAIRLYEQIGDRYSIARG